MTPSLAANVATVLEEIGVSFCLVGASALAVHGYVRGTFDVDFMTVNAAVLELDWSSRLEANPRVQILRGDFDDPLRGTVRITSECESVVVVVAKWTWQANVIERSRKMDLGALIVPVPLPEDLVLLKLDAGSFSDERDSAQLIEIHGEPLVERIRNRLPDVPERLREAFERLMLQIGEELPDDSK